MRWKCCYSKTGASEKKRCNRCTHILEIMFHVNIITRKRRATFSFAELTPLNVLESYSEEELAVAYAQSHAAVELLKKKHGERRYALMLQHLRRGLDAEEALKQTYRINYRMLESQLNSMIDQF